MSLQYCLTKARNSYHEVGLCNPKYFVLYLQIQSVMLVCVLKWCVRYMLELVFMYNTYLKSGYIRKGEDFSICFRMFQMKNWSHTIVIKVRWAGPSGGGGIHIHSWHHVLNEKENWKKPNWFYVWTCSSKISQMPCTGQWAFKNVHMNCHRTPQIKTI
jgi:hypothetical protein